jgi:CDP-diacylglycerol---serine O-phosphatidyltransferase
MSATKQGEVERQSGARFRKTIYLLPNLLTAANMVLGILAIAYAINDSLNISLASESKVVAFVWPARFILMAIFLDFMDGRVARATGTTSKFGMEFDSMSDLVSFGVAPAILIYLSVLRYMSFWGICITVLYVVCVAVRLARFNVQAMIEEKDHFMGLPSPAAAGLLASYVLLSRWDGWFTKGTVVKKLMSLYGENMNYVESIAIPALTILVALVMVSTIRYPSLKKWKTETVKPWTLVMVVMVVFLVIYAAELTAFILLTTYLFWGLIHLITRKGTDRLRNRAAH